MGKHLKLCNMFIYACLDIGTSDRTTKVQPAPPTMFSYVSNVEHSSEMGMIG